MRIYFLFLLFYVKNDLRFYQKYPMKQERDDCIDFETGKGVMEMLQGVSNQNVYVKPNQQTVQTKQAQTGQTMVSQDIFVKEHTWEQEVKVNCYSPAMIEQNQNRQENHNNCVEAYIAQLQNRLDFEIADEMKEMWKEHKHIFEHYQKLIDDLLKKANVHGQQYGNGMAWDLKLEKNGTLYFSNKQAQAEQKDAVEKMLEDFKERWKEQNKNPIKPLNLVTYRKEKGGRHITEIMGQNGQIVRLEFVRRVKYSPAKDVGRLASLSNVANTKSFIVGLNANMNRISKDQFADKEEIRATVAKMKQVIGKAKVKIRKLKAEEVEKKRMEEAKQEEELKKAREIAENLRKMKTKRKIGEHIPVKGEYMPQYLLPKKKDKSLYETGLGLSEFSGMSYQVVTTGAGTAPTVMPSTTPVATTNVSQAVQVAEGGGIATISVNVDGLLQGIV